MATISFRAEMTNLRAELAKVPGITEAEAKRMVAALSKQLKEAEIGRAHV
jgi:Holliday junction resolvasome RuvABC DNA-binding subunit